MKRVVLAILVGLCGTGTAWAGQNPAAKLAMHVVASDQYLDCRDLIPAACESINVDVSTEEILAANGYGYVALVAYDVEGITGLEFAVNGWPTGRGAPVDGPTWCPEGALTLGDQMDGGGITSFPCAEAPSSGIVLLAYLSFGPLDEGVLPIELEYAPSSFTYPNDPHNYVLDCTANYQEDPVVAVTGCTIGGVHGPWPDCGAEPEGGGEGTGTLRVDEVWSMGEGPLPEGLSLPVRAIWSPTPGQIRLFRPNGEVERDVQLPYPAGGYFSCLSEDGSLAILRSGGITVRGPGRLSTRVVDLREERVLFEGESSGNEAFLPSPGGEMVLHYHSRGSSALRRADLSLIKSTNSLVVKWDFSRQYLATLEVDLTGQDTRRSGLRWPPIKGPLYLRVYDLQGNTVLDEFLEEISAGIDIDIADEGTVAALYRKYDVARWTPPGTYPSSDFVLVLRDSHGASTERRSFTVERDTRHADLVLSPNARYLALEVFAPGSVDLYELDAILGNPGGLCRPVWTSSLPQALPGEPEVEVRGSGTVLHVSGRGLVVNKVLCQQGDRRYERILVSDGQGTWWPIPTPDLDLGGILCRFFGPDDYLLVGKGSFLKCFRIAEE